MKVGIIDTAFWLYGDLRISAIEQIHFLELLYLRKLGFKDHSYEVLKEIMLDSKTDNYQIYGKTGWVDDIGWYVGYVETKKGVWLFATRLEGVNKSIFTNDSLKANEEYKPASTFKILHTLIALDGKYISELDTIKWDKKIRAIDLWNSDQTLKSAFKYSCVWAYEAIEKRIGIVNYQKYLDQSNYEI